MTSMSENVTKIRRQVAIAVTIALMGAGIAAGTAWASGDSDKTQQTTAPAGGDDYAKAVKAVQAKDFTGALTLLKQVVAKDPGNADAWNYIGFADRQLGKFPESLAAYENALAIKPNHVGANEYLGELYVQTGETEKARAQLAKLLDLCGAGCDEYKELKAAIASGKAAALDRPGGEKGW
jgi:cytochrome c-type biogenesis protein CcmH/NrfG